MLKKTKTKIRDKGNVALGLAVISAISAGVVAAAAAIGTVAGTLYWRTREKSSSETE